MNGYNMYIKGEKITFLGSPFTKKTSKAVSRLGSDSAACKQQRQSIRPNFSTNLGRKLSKLVPTRSRVNTQNTTKTNPQPGTACSRANYSAYYQTTGPRSVWKEPHNREDLSAHRHPDFNISHDDVDQSLSELVSSVKPVLLVQLIFIQEEQLDDLFLLLLFPDQLLPGSLRTVSSLLLVSWNFFNLSITSPRTSPFSCFRAGVSKSAY